MALEGHIRYSVFRTLSPPAPGQLSAGRAFLHEGKVAAQEFPADSHPGQKRNLFSCILAGGTRNLFSCNSSWWSGSAIHHLGFNHTCTDGMCTEAKKTWCHVDGPDRKSIPILWNHWRVSPTRCTWSARGGEVIFKRKSGWYFQKQGDGMLSKKKMTSLWVAKSSPGLLRAPRTQMAPQWIPSHLKKIA